MIYLSIPNIWIAGINNSKSSIVSTADTYSRTVSALTHMQE